MQAEEARAGGGTPLFTTFGEITKAVRTYRNLVVFERGDNDYPSNNKFDLDHPNVVRISEVIAQEGLASPSSGAYLTRIDMAIWARRYDQAVALSREAIRFYPTNSRVLIYVYQIFERLGYSEDCQNAAKNLVQLLPSDPEARRMAIHYGKSVDQGPA